MCTAVSYRTKDHYFGRTLDHTLSYGEAVTITPRNYPFPFRAAGCIRRHYAMIGIAHVAENYPLYYDAVNEKGLCMAGLNFVTYAHFQESVQDKDNVASFEFIPWLLCQCQSVSEARRLLDQLNLTNTPFSRELAPAQLHWLIADRHESITVEAMKDGIHVYPNPVGVLTNNPPFDMQMFQLNNYMHLSPHEPLNRFSHTLPLFKYSRGMGAMGLPGDLSSQSRFIRAAFTKINSVSDDSEAASLSQFFHILGSVAQARGCCVLEDGSHEITIYSSCANADRGIYYYTTYTNRQITAVDMRRENLDASSLLEYPLIQDQGIRWQN